MRSTPWNNFRPQNDASLSVHAPIKAISPKLPSGISERDCQRIARIKCSTTSFPRNKKEWAWVSLSFDRLLRRMVARLLARMPLIVAHEWLFGCRLRAEKFRKARRRHERIG